MPGRYPPPAETPTPPTTPACGGPCRRRGVVLYQGLCQRCIAADEREKERES